MPAVQKSIVADIKPSSNMIFAALEEVEQDQNTNEQYTGLVAGIKNLEEVILIKLIVRSIVY